MKIIKPYYSFITDEETIKRIPETIEKIGRVAYQSTPKTNEPYETYEFIKNLIKRGHESVLEHCAISVEIVCDRGISHELVRHRLASYTQESTRYCNYSKDKFGNELTFIKPCFWEEDSIELTLWWGIMLEVEKIYLKLLNRGATPQEARSVLPNSLKTTIVMTCNLRQWRHFFKLRTQSDCHPQMLELTRPMLAYFKILLPCIFNDINF